MGKKGKIQDTLGAGGGIQQEVAARYIQEMMETSKSEILPGCTQVWQAESICQESQEEIQVCRA